HQGLFVSVSFSMGTNYALLATLPRYGHVLLAGRFGRHPGGDAGPRLSARSKVGAALRPGLSLSAGGLDRSPYRGQAVRTRLPARAAAGPGDRGLRAQFGHRDEP